jgi:hypothetical protein
MPGIYEKGICINVENVKKKKKKEPKVFMTKLVLDGGLFTPLDRSKVQFQP